MAPTKVDPSDPNVRRLVYNMYRGMLGGYNDQANTIVDALPPERVREDQGIYKQLESIIRQSSQPGDAAHSPDVGGGGSIPPPPPPPVPGGALPSLRINSEIDGRGRSPKPTAPGEPPAAIQNAMMTKDKKPFTYTPGGLDLSQIRSPRIQRRINRNMADEGVGPLPPQQEHGPLPPAAQAAMQPNIQVQVLPPMAPPPPPPPPQAGLGPQPSRFGGAAPVPPHQPAPFAPPLGGAQASVSAQAVQQTAANLRPTNIAPLRRVEQQPEPGSLYIAPITPSATPTAPATPRSQLGSLYIPPVDVPDAASPPPPPQRHYSPQSPQASLNKAPTPWMSSLHQQQPQQQQQQARQMASPTIQSAGPGTPGTRIIPIQIEGREPSTPHTPQSPQEAHLSQWQREQQLRQQQRQQQPQFQQPQYQQPQFQQPQYQQPQYQQPQYQQQQQQVPWRTAQQQPSSPPVQPVHQVQQGGERLIPMQVEGATSNGISRQQQQRRPPGPAQQQNSNSGAEWGAGPPIQSQSFRVLQKITDDPVAGSSVPRNQQPGRMNEMNAAQLRKLQLNEEDQALMNRFKAQVDDEVYLHQESDPRYRGAAIPSRAFRMLQNMTGEDDGSAPMPSRISPAVRAAQQAVQEASQPYVPPSEQTVQEPRKYTGGAIPSRSFRMLQAMTGSENCDPADTSDL